MSRPTVSMEFDSVSALGTYLQTAGGQILDSGDNPGGAFYGKTTLPGAIETACGGGVWSEGARQIQPVDLDVDRLRVTHDLPQPELVTDVQGFAPCVPQLYSGSPETMFALTPIDRPARVLRVGVHIGRAGVLEQSDVFARGNAILSVVNALQALGWQCEIWACWINSDGRRTADIRTLVKAADRHWDPDSVAFALCHAAFNRRLMWRMAESHSKALGSAFFQTYGDGTEADMSGFDISFGYQTDKVTLPEILAQSMEQLKRLS